jgi:hypothetical protein
MFTVARAALLFVVAVGFGSGLHAHSVTTPPLPVVPPPAGSGCLSSTPPADPLPASGWTFFPASCTWGAGTNWSVGGGPGAVWQQQGEMSSQPTGHHSQPAVDYNVAFANAPLQPPLTVNFTWVWHHMWGGVGLVFRAHGTADYYEVSFPAVGQAQRSEMVWVLVSRVRTAQGWREGLHFSLLPGVASEPGLRHRTRVDLGVSELVVTVDDRAIVRVPLPADPGPFRVGASSYTLSDVFGLAFKSPSFPPAGTLSNFSVAGTPPTAMSTPATPFAWTTARMASSEVHAANATTGKTGLLPTSPWGVGQAVRVSRGGVARERLRDVFMINGGQLLHTVDGLSLVPCSVVEGALGTCSNSTSTDIPPIVAAGILASAEVNDGGLVQLTVFTMDMNAPSSPLPSFPQGKGTYCINGCVKSAGWLRILRSSSLDSGRSWVTDPQAVWSHRFAGHGTVWNPNGTATGAAGGDFVAVLPSQILQLRSGKLLFMFEVNTLATESGWSGAGGSFLEQPPPGGVMYSLSSSDLGGASWTSLANLDGPPYITTPPTGVDTSPVLWVAEGRGQFGSEIAATELANGNILAFIRPHYSPYMIEALSKTGGAEWTPLAKGHFPMYACGTAAVTTANGAVLVGGRFPGTGLQVSWDNAMSFRTFTIDSAGHGQGTMVEIAPNIVLYIYGGPHLRQQLIRVRTDPDEITPVSKLEADELMAKVHAPTNDIVLTATSHHPSTAELRMDQLNLSDAGWDFLGSSWSVSSSANGTALTAPTNNEDNFAFHRSAVLQGSWRADFEFQWQYFFTTAGFIFGAENSSSFFQLDFPWNSGGPMDAKPEYMYASLSRVRGQAGWREQGTLQLLHGVSCNPQLWHNVAVEVDARTANVTVVTMTIDGRNRVHFTFPEHWPAPSGFVGLATYSTLGKEKRARFRNFRVAGKQRVTNQIELSPQLPMAAGRAPAPAKVDAGFSPTGVGNIVSNGNTMFVTNCGASSAAGSPVQQCWLLRAPITRVMPVWSRDPVPLPQEWITPVTDHGIALRGTRRQLEAYFVQPPTMKAGQRIFRVGRSSSSDGKRWSAAQTVWSSEDAQLPPPGAPSSDKFTWTDFEALGSCQLLELRHTASGTPELLMFLQLTTNATSITRADDTGVKVFTRPAPPGTQSFTVRSTTGLSWSADMAPLNGAPCCWDMVNKGQSQISATELNDGRVLAMLRPDTWEESMWEVWSDVPGVSWGPLARGHFPMYASPDAMLTTAAGVLLIGGRFPAMSVQASWDNGKTWTFFNVDTQFYGYGAMFEVAPAVVVFMYGGELDAEACGCTPSLRQVLFRVEADRIVAL